MLIFKAVLSLTVFTKAKELVNIDMNNLKVIEINFSLRNNIFNLLNSSFWS
jgi:hypothetical protein